MIKVISKLLFFFSRTRAHTHTHTQMHKFRFQLIHTFFHSPSHFSDFFCQFNPHSESLFLILRRQGFTLDSMYGLLFLLRALQDSIDITASKLFIFSSIYTRTAKTSYSKKIIVHLAP